MAEQEQTKSIKLNDLPSRPDAHFHRLYTNYVSVGIVAREFVMRCRAISVRPDGQTYEMLELAQLILPPYCAKGLAQALQQQVNLFEEHYGPIEEP